VLNTPLPVTEITISSRPLTIRKRDVRVFFRTDINSHIFCITRACTRRYNRKSRTDKHTFRVRDLHTRVRLLCKVCAGRVRGLRGEISLRRRPCCACEDPPGLQRPEEQDGSSAQEVGKEVRGGLSRLFPVRRAYTCHCTRSGLLAFLPPPPLSSTRRESRRKLRFL